VVKMSLLSEHMRAIACELEIMVVRAGVTMPPRALTLINELHDWIGDLEESDKRLEWAYSEGDEDDE
jgi:hypothetical protein